MAAILGKDPWKTALDVVLEKKGLVEHVGEQDMAKSMGQYLEPALLSWTEDQLGVPIERDRMLIHPNGILCANLDGLVLDASPPAIIEAKTSGLIRRPEFFDDFGEAGSDAVPEHILVQTQHQLAVLNALPEMPRVDVAYVPALLVGRGFVRFEIRRDPELGDLIVEAAEQAWKDYILGDAEPPGAGTWETLKKRRRIGGKMVEIDALLIAQWQVAREERLAAEKEEERAVAALLTALGDAEAGTSDMGTVHYTLTKRAGYTVQPTEYRTLRFKKPKAEKGAA